MVIQDTQRGNDDRHHRWERIERADLFTQYGDLRAQGLSQRQAAQKLDVPRSTLQAWQAYHDSLDECPAVVAFFHSVLGLAFLHRLVLALHLVCVEVGACGIRLVCLLLQLTGLNRFVGASYGTQHQVNRRVEEAIVAYRHAESTRLAHEYLAMATNEPAQRGPGRPPKGVARLEQVKDTLEVARDAHQRLSAQREQVTQCIRAIGQAYHFVDVRREAQ